MAPVRSALGFAACSALALFSPAALAQVTSTTVGGGSVGTGNVIVDRVKRTRADHDDTFEFHVSQEDCLSSDEFQFPITLSQLSGVLTLEVWIGEGSADCSALGARNGTGGTAQCTRIYENGAPEQYMEIGITSREIAETGLGIDDCIDESASSEPRTVGIYFMLIRDPAVDVPGTDYAQWTQTKVDLLGPSPPTSVDATASDEAVDLEYKVPTNASDTVGFRFYCDDGTLELAESTTSAGAGGGGGNGGAGGLGGNGGAAGSGGDGGTTLIPVTATVTTSSSVSTGVGGGGGGTPTGCAGTVLKAGDAPNPAWRSCGSAKGTTGKGAATDLTNGVEYAIAVAAYDELDNVGVLSAVVCAKPFPVNDFYELYRQSGGEAGGGLCACDVPGGRSAGGAAASLAAVALTSALALRRARTRAGARNGLRDARRPRGDGR